MSFPHVDKKCQFSLCFSPHRFPDAETASAIEELGCKHICKDVNEAHIDATNRIVTTCAFMCKAPLHEIFDGIGAMVSEVLKLA